MRKWWIASPAGASRCRRRGLRCSSWPGGIAGSYGCASRPRGSQGAERLGGQAGGGAGPALLAPGATAVIAEVAVQLQPGDGQQAHQVLGDVVVGGGAHGRVPLFKMLSLIERYARRDKYVQITSDSVADRKSTRLNSSHSQISYA